MKQYNIFGQIDVINEEFHPQIENKKINENYYGSELNRFVAKNCKTDMVVNNIDLIINDYKTKTIRIIESKHSKEKLSKGQDILLSEITKKGIMCYVVYGDFPYDSVEVFSYASKETRKMNKHQLIKFLNNEWLD